MCPAALVEDISAALRATLCSSGREQPLGILMSVPVSLGLPVNSQQQCSVHHNLLFILDTSAGSQAVFWATCTQFKHFQMHSSSTTGNSSRILGREFGGKGYFSLLGFMRLACIWIGQGKVVLPKK